jgi:hypothetical protein
MNEFNWLGKPARFLKPRRFMFRFHSARWNNGDCVMRLFFLYLILILYGCSADTVKRVTYNTVHNIGQQQCQKNLATDCKTQQNYDLYQNELKVVQ